MYLTIRRSERGVALTETVLMMSFISLLMFGLIQTGLAAFYQVSADGASFVGAHTAIQNDPNTTGSGAGIAAQAAETVFTGIGAATVHLFHPTATTTETDISFASLNDGPAGSSIDPKTYSRVVDSSAAASSATAASLPPTGTVLCLDNAINSTTGALTNASIGGYTPGTLETVASSSANAISGSLSITPTTLGATFGTSQPPSGIDGALTDVANAQVELSTDLQTVNADLAYLTSIPVLGPPIVATITGPGGTQTLNPGVNTLAGQLSGPTGAVSSAAQGVLSSSQVAAIQGLINYGSITGTGTGLGATTGILSALNALPVLYKNDPRIQSLIAKIGDITPSLNALNAAEGELTAIDTKTAKPACKASAGLPSH